jgi:hypothetical protein
MLGSAGFLTTAEELARLQLAVAGARVLSDSSFRELTAPRGAMSLGQATYGAFLIEHPALGRVLSARGFEDWGDNAILNHYLEHDTIVVVVTSKGPLEGAGEPFRNTISNAIEGVLATRAAVR